jgi:superfamily II DNA/RNA helicase
MKDVKDVGYVIVSVIVVSSSPCAYGRSQNYDFPNNCEDYIHRIGRTGVRLFAFVAQFDLLIQTIACRNERNLLYVLHDGQREAGPRVDRDPARI